MTLAYGAALDQRADLGTDVYAELLADLRLELVDEPELDHVVDEDRVRRDTPGAEVGELEGGDPSSAEYTWSRPV